MVLRDVPYNVQLATVFGVALLIYAAWKSPLFHPKTAVVTPVNTHPTTAQTESGTDTDSDGLKNWEEELLGTEPNNPDTNGDGVSDYDEIITAHGSVTAALFGARANASPTDAYASTILGSYVESKKQGAYDEETFSRLIAQVTDAQFSKRPNATTYTANDITTRPATESARNAYFTKLRESLEPLTSIPEYEFTTFTYAVEQQDQESFALLQKDADVYSEVIEALKKLPAPEDAAQQHIALINAFSRLSETLTAMSKVSSDPIEILVATRNFFEAEDAVRNAYTQLDIYFTLNSTAL